MMVKEKNRLPSLGGNLYGLVATVKGGRFVVTTLTSDKASLIQKSIEVIKQLQVALGGVFKVVHSDAN